jgi:predicted dehydrogenase
MKQLNVGLIGMRLHGPRHSNAFRKVGNFFDLEYQPVLKAICAPTRTRSRPSPPMGLRIRRDRLEKLIARDDIDLIDICLPNNAHAEIAIAAAKAGKMILCEKPLARDGAEGPKMVAAIEKAKVPNMVWYNYRRVPP